MTLIRRCKVLRFETRNRSFWPKNRLAVKIIKDCLCYESKHEIGVFGQEINLPARIIEDCLCYELKQVE